MKNNKIVVLMGGWNSEKEVSLKSGESVFKSLQRLGYKNIEKLIFDRDIAKKLTEIMPDIVFNALHGKFGEDGKIQGLLDIMGIKYTHSGVLASAICMDKFMCNKICSAIGIKIPKSEILNKNNENNDKIIANFKKPFVIKPIDDGSSVGVEIISENDDFNINNYSWEFGEKVMIEEYISGKEIQVANIDNKAIGVLEVRPKKLFYDYECKYNAGMTDYIMPAEISEEKYQEAMDLSIKIHNHFECKGISRAEFILSNKDSQIYFLEINTHPGFTDTSLVPKIAQFKGISFDDIVEYLINSAKCGN